MSEIIIGIDLGTTNSLASWVSEVGAEIIENETLTTQTPSMVTLLKEGVLVGEEARKKRMEFSDTTFYSIKRFMGRGARDIEEDLSKLPFKVSVGERDNLLLVGDGIRFSPEQFSAEILRRIKNQAEEILNEKIEKAVITVPAYFDDGQRQATRDAANIAGLEAVRIINEPTAAAIAYGLDEKKKGKIAVFDFGGGTFDVSILELKDKIFKVLSTHGNTHLGGDDIDHRIMEALQTKILPLDQAIDNSLLSQTRQYLKHIAEEIKIELTSTLEVTKQISLPWLDIEESFTFTREKFNTIIAPIVDETLDHVRLAIKDAGLSKDAIEEIVMVGGSTRIPLVREKVRDFFNLAPHVRINPDQVVAIGAGIQGHLLAGGRKDFLLMDVIPLSLGIETLGGTFSKLIIKNASIPAKAMEIFSTSVDNQTGVVIAVYQGEREFVQDCRFLGKFILKGIPPMPAGLPQVEVAFFVDASGILTVTAKERRSGVETQIEIVPSHGLKRSEVTQMIADSFNYAVEDFNQRNFVEFKNTAQRVLDGIDKVWPNAEKMLTTEQIDSIRAHIPVLQLAMEGGDPIKLKNAIDQMGNLTRDFADSIMGAAIQNALVKEE